MHRQLANGKRNFPRFCFSKAGRHVLLVFMFSQLFLQRKLETQALSNRQLLDQLPLYRSALLLVTNAIHCFCSTNTLKRKIDSKPFFVFHCHTGNLFAITKKHSSVFSCRGIKPATQNSIIDCILFEFWPANFLMICGPCSPILVSSIRKYNAFFFISLSIRSLYLPTLHLLKGHHKDGCCNLR